MSTNKSRSIVGVLAALTLVVLVFSTGSQATAQLSGQPAGRALFVDPAGHATPPAQPGVIRSRYVAINLDALGKPGAPAPTVVLNLFDDTTFFAVLDRAEVTYRGSFTWVGRLQGVGLGQAILVVTKGVLAANIAMPGAIYSVRPGGTGAYIVEELDQSAFPQEMEPIAVPRGRGAWRQGLPGVEDECTEISVLVAYTPEARAADGGTAAIEARIALAVEETNQSYENSGLVQRMILVHTLETAPGDAQNDFGADLAALQDTTDGIFDEADAARETHHADEVALIIENDSSCGLGYVDATAEWAFVTVHRTCATGYYSFGHELGHNMGAYHDWYADDDGTYQHGFVYINDPTRWRTIMAYNDLCEDTPPGDYCERLQYWSNPDVLYGGVPMGVVWDGPTDCVAGSTVPDPSTCAADNRRRLNETCSTVANFRQNDPPVLTVDVDPVTVDEGQTAYNTGTVTDPDGDVVTLTTSLGSVTNNGDGTWSWSYTTDDGPAESQLVYVYGDDGAGGTAEVSFDLIVNNVAPTATFNSPTDVNEGDSFELSLTDPYDPSSADTAAGFEYDFDCGGGYDGWSSDNTATCQTYDDGILTVKGKIQDKDGGATEYVASVTVHNLPPVMTVDIPIQTVQYSDYICDVTFTATDVAADPLTASTTPLPDSLALVDQGCVPSDDGIWHTCTWTLEGTMDEPQGSYTIEVTVDDGDGGTATEDTTVIVEPEDANVWLDPDNPVTVRVDTPGGDSPAFILTAYAQERLPDDAACGPDPGDIGDAQVSISLVPVGPGSTVTELCTNVDVSGSGYDAILTAECEFEDVPVNVYYVQATVVGGYYTSGTVEAILVVYDPSLGFTTGGGWFYWPGTDDKTNFAFTVKYNRSRRVAQGNLLLIRHLEDGSIYRLKSKGLIGLAIGDYEEGGTNVGWASFVGRAIYSEPGWSEPVGGYRFIVYVEDWNEPGVGYDQFWIELQDESGLGVSALSMDRPAVDNTVTLEGGNIAVPHNPD